MAEQSSIASRRSSTRAKRKPKKNQIPFGLILVAIIVAIGIWLGTSSGKLVLFWTTGICFGVILQKGRFCFTASMRDPYLTGSTSITRAVLIAFGVATVGFAAIKYGYYVMGLPMPGMSYVVPVSFGTVIGAFMFGVGMVIAGGCASGTLMRVGEGFHMQIISLLFFIAGSLLGAQHFGWWKENVISKGKAIFLPDVFGGAGALFIQLLIIGLLYVAAEKYEEKRKEN
ncbi:MAG: YeeE/YedE family protein [Clostridiales bacterium]|nr:YeeE/YedE family protein [Clostridiales bacterium]